MAEILDFASFASDFCVEGNPQWALGIKGIQGESVVLVEAELTKANNDISSYYNCPNGPSYANMVIRSSQGDANCYPWTPDIAQIIFPVGTKRPSELVDGQSYECDEVTLVAYNLVPDSQTEANIYAAVTYKKNDETHTECVLRPKYHGNDITIDIIDCGFIEAQGSMPEGKNRVTPSNFHRARKVGTGRGPDIAFQYIQGKGS